MSGWQYQQNYDYSKLRNFLCEKQAEIIMQLMNWRGLSRFNFFDTRDMIVATQGPGVYLFILDRKIKYVGSSKEMRRRILKHKKKYEEGDRVITILTGENENRQLEWEVTALIQPPGNKIKSLYGVRW